MENRIKPAETPWFVVSKTYFVMQKGLVVVGGEETDEDFLAAIGDLVEIHRPNGSRTRSRIADIFPSQTRTGGDLLLEGLKGAEVPPGCRLRVMSGHKKKRRT